MGVYKDTAEVEIRERRLRTIIDYNGSAEQLLKDAAKGHIKCPGRLFDQCSDCPEARSETTVMVVRDTAMVSHAPVGCMVDSSNKNARLRGNAELRGMVPLGVHYISSNIMEKDTVYGAAYKLQVAIREANRRFHPKAIFVLSSCAAGIIGEDVESISNGMEKELGYPVVPIYCEGFKTNTWSYGFDAGFHGSLRKLVKEPKKRQTDLVNMFAFRGIDVYTEPFRQLGLRINWLQPMTTSLENIGEMSEAACSVHICETLASYVAASLEERYGVPEVKTPPPYGIDWTDAWFREIGRLTNRSAKVEIYIAEEHKRIKDRVSRLRERLEGKTVYIVSGDTYAHNIANVVKDLGLEVIGIDMLHHDLHPDTAQQAYLLRDYTKKQGNMMHVRVCNKQPYQMLKVISRLHPDFVIVRHNGLTSLGTKLGIPTLLENDAPAGSCYAGVLRMGRRLLQAEATRKFYRNIAAHSSLPYTDWWIKQKNIRLEKENINE